MRKSSKYKFYILTLLAAMFQWACVETLIAVRVFPDGKFSMIYRTKGDSADVFNNDFPHPKGQQWNTSIAQEKQGEEIVWVMETSAFLTGSTDYSEQKDSLTALRHPLTVTVSDGFFTKRYHLVSVFQGRKAFVKYPLFAKSLEESHADSTLWLKEVYYYLLSQALKDLQTDSSTAINNKLAERLDNHFKNTLYHMEYNHLLDQLNFKDAFISRVLQPFRRQLPDGYDRSLSKSSNRYENEFRLTSELQDDRFNYNAFLPGRITKTNADTIAGDTLKWAFDLKNFIHEDYSIEAASVVYLTQRIRLTIIVVAGLLLFVLLALIIKK